MGLKKKVLIQEGRETIFIRPYSSSNPRPHPPPLAHPYPPLSHPFLILPPPPPRYTRYWWVVSVYVSEPWRRMGVGTALFKSMLFKAKGMGAAVRSVNLRVEKENVNAQRFYASLGFAGGDKGGEGTKGQGDGGMDA